MIFFSSLICMINFFFNAFTSVFDRTETFSEGIGLFTDGWEEVAGHYADADAFRSVADVVDPTSLQRVCDFKREAKKAAKKKASESSATATT